MSCCPAVPMDSSIYTTRPSKTKTRLFFRWSITALSIMPASCPTMLCTRLVTTRHSRSILSRIQTCQSPAIRIRSNLEIYEASCNVNTSYRPWVPTRDHSFWLQVIRRKLFFFLPESFPPWVEKKTSSLFSSVSLNSEQRLNLFPIISSPGWDLDLSNFWYLPEAHGDEIVRTVYLDEQVRSSLLIQLL